MTNTRNLTKSTQQSSSIELVGGVGERIPLTIDLTEAGNIEIMSRLTDLYSNPLEASIRETVSNAMDATLLSGNNTPVSIRLPSDFYNYIEIEDKGVGMSYEDIHNVVSKYGSSTKRDDFSQTGAYGLGLKAPLSYTNHFTISSSKDGKRNSIVVSKSSGFNIDILERDVETSEQGTKVTIPINSEDVTRARFIALRYSQVPSIVKVEYPDSPLIIKELSEHYIELHDDLLLLKDYQGQEIRTRSWQVNKGVDISKLMRVALHPTNDILVPAQQWKASDVNIFYVISGWIYASPENRLSSVTNVQQRDINPSFLIELPPGVLQFDSSRDSITNNNHSKSLHESIIKNLQVGYINALRKGLYKQETLCEANKLPLITALVTAMNAGEQVSTYAEEAESDYVSVSPEMYSEALAIKGVKVPMLTSVVITANRKLNKITALTPHALSVTDNGSPFDELGFAARYTTRSWADRYREVGHNYPVNEVALSFGTDVQRKSDREDDTLLVSDLTEIVTRNLESEMSLHTRNFIFDAMIEDSKFGPRKPHVVVTDVDSENMARVITKRGAWLIHNQSGVLTITSASKAEIRTQVGSDVENLKVLKADEFLEVPEIKQIDTESIKERFHVPGYEKMPIDLARMVTRRRLRYLHYKDSVYKNTLLSPTDSGLPLIVLFNTACLELKVMLNKLGVTHDEYLVIEIEGHTIAGMSVQEFNMLTNLGGEVLLGKKLLSHYEARSKNRTTILNYIENYTGPELAIELTELEKYIILIAYKAACERSSTNRDSENNINAIKFGLTKITAHAINHLKRLAPKEFTLGGNDMLCKIAQLKEDEWNDILANLITHLDMATESQNLIDINDVEEVFITLLVEHAYLVARGLRRGCAIDVLVVDQLKSQFD